MYKKPIIKQKLSDNQQSMLNLMRLIKGENMPLRQAAKEFYELRYPTGIQNHVCTQMRKKATHHKSIFNEGRNNLKPDYFLHCIGSTDYVVEEWSCKKVRKQITKWDGTSTFVPTGEYEEYYNLYLKGYWLNEIPKKKCTVKRLDGRDCIFPIVYGQKYCKNHKWRIEKSNLKVTHAGLHPKFRNEDGSQMTVEERKAKYVNWMTSDDWPNPIIIDPITQISNNTGKQGNALYDEIMLNSKYHIDIRKFFNYVYQYEPVEGYTREQPVDRINGKKYFEYLDGTVERKYWHIVKAVWNTNIQMDKSIKIEGVSKFEEYIISKGYIPFNIDHVTNKFCQFTGKTVPYSSMGTIDLIYIKDGDIEKGHRIIYGLHEAGHHPNLVTPRPDVKVKRFIKDTIFKNLETKNNDYIWLDEKFDSTIEVLFQNETVEDIFDSLFDKNKKFEYDLTKITL